MTYSRVDEVAIVDSERVVAKEMFRAQGIQWVRYKRPNGENRYSPVEEWDEWAARSSVTVSRRDIVRK